MACCELPRLRPRRAGPSGEKRANVFERYTEKARRVIFFARYEASQYGSPYIETEHLLLGLMREDKALATSMLAPSICFSASCARRSASGRKFYGARLASLHVARRAGAHLRRKN